MQAGDIENQNQPAGENRGNSCYDNSLICLARWLPCICGGAEIGIMATIGFIFGQDRANALSEIIHNLFAYIYNGARAAVIDEQVDENADDLDDDMGDEHPNVAEFARNADELVVTAVEATRIFAAAILNGFLARYTPITPAMRISIETLLATLATDIEWLVRYGVINPVARLTVNILDLNHFVYGMFAPPRDDDAPPLPQEVIDPPEEAPGLLNRILRSFYPAYEDEYEDEENNYVTPHTNPDEEGRNIDNPSPQRGVVANEDGLIAGETITISEDIQQIHLLLDIENSEQKSENKEIVVGNQIQDNERLILLLENIFLAWEYMEKWLQEIIIKSTPIQSLLNSEAAKEAIYNPKSAADNSSQLFIRDFEVNTTNEAEDNVNERATYAKVSSELIDTSLLYDGVKVGICVLPMVMGASNNLFGDLISIE